MNTQVIKHETDTESEAKTATTIALWCIFSCN